MDINEFSKHLQKLKAEPIDPSKCTVNTSFRYQIFHNVGNRNTKSEQRQREQFKDEINKFNLANGNTFQDALQAADYLLKRELGDTFLFDNSLLKPVFIPAFFISKLYKKDASYIDYDYMKFFLETRNNSKINDPNCWFTKELDAFLLTKKKFSPAEFDEWIMKIKILYLIKAKVSQPSSSNDSHRINSCDDIMQFIASCSDYLNNYKNHPYFTDFQKLKYNQKDQSLDKARNWVKKQKKELQLPLSPLILEWFFNFNLLDISGEEPEKSLFDSLKKAFHSEDINDSKFVVLHASQIMVDGLGKKSKEQEFDFLLFSADRKLVIGIEVKRSLQKQKPFDQLETYKSILEEGLGDQFKEGWTYLPVICIHEPTYDMLKVVSGSHESKIHFIHSMTNVAEWIKNICLKYPVKYSPEGIEQLKNVLKILVFVLQMSVKSLRHNPSAPCGQIVSSKWVDFVEAAIETISTTENITFYSQNQLLVFHSNNPRYNKLVLRGCYGTGKTFLLRKKAEWLAEKGEKVIYYIHKNTNHKTLLQISLEKDWKSKYDGRIRLMNEKDCQGEWKQRLIEFSKQNGEHIFIDEMTLMDIRDVKDMFAELEDKFVWIASVANDEMNRSKNFEKYETERFFYAMRNCEEVLKFAQESGEMIGGSVIMPLAKAPSLLPHGLSPTNVNTVKKAVEALDATMRILVIISQRLQSKPNKVKEIYKQMKEVFKEKNGMEIACYFDSDKLRRLGGNIKLVGPEECLKSLEEGVLMVDHKIAHGFECERVLLVSDKPETLDNNLILRCTAKLVVLRIS